jgi:hypothetical protein
MKQNQFDMSAGKVTLDLPSLKDILGYSTYRAKCDLQNDIRDISDEFEKAFRAEMKNDKQENYYSLCHAHTHREYLLNAANHYADCIEAYFHVCEAIKRDETIIIKQRKEKTK